MNRNPIRNARVSTSGLVFAQDYAWRVRDLVASVPQAWGATHRFQTNPIPAYLPRHLRARQPQHQPPSRV
jgi:hypothetical protein